MAQPKIAFPVDSFFSRILQTIDEQYSFECHNPKCPVLGLHNTDECADLVAEMRMEGWRSQ